MTQQNSFIFYRSFFEATKPLEDSDQLSLFKAITHYALNGEETELSPIAKAMFGLIKPQLEANKTRYENGKKGGRPKPKHNRNRTGTEPDNNQNVTKAEPNKNYNYNLNSNLNKNEREDSLNLFKFCLNLLKEEDRTDFQKKPEEIIPDQFADAWSARKGVKYDSAMWKAWAKFFNHNLGKERNDWSCAWINWVISEEIYEKKQQRK